MYAYTSTREWRLRLADLGPAALAPILWTSPPILAALIRHPDATYQDWSEWYAECDARAQELSAQHQGPVARWDGFLASVPRLDFQSSPQTRSHFWHKRLLVFSPQDEQFLTRFQEDDADPRGHTYLHFRRHLKSLAWGYEAQVEFRACVRAGTVVAVTNRHKENPLGKGWLPVAKACWQTAFDLAQRLRGGEVADYTLDFLLARDGLILLSAGPPAGGGPTDADPCCFLPGVPVEGIALAPIRKQAVKVVVPKKGR